MRYNAPNVQSQVNNWIDALKGGSNPAGISVAAVQADVVAHSMGGLVARQMVLQPGFLNPDTFGQGNIHKLITIDTPHLGSQVALNILGQGQFSETGCLQQLLAKNGKFAIESAVLGDGTIVPGASGDLQGDNNTGAMSADLQRLNRDSRHPIPWAPIEGQYSDFSKLDSQSPLNPAKLIRLFCNTDPLALQLTSTGWPQIFHGEANDAIVSVKSQENGISGAGALISDEVHSPGTEKLGFAGPSMLDAGVVPDLVITLLNTPLNDTAYYFPINP